MQKWHQVVSKITEWGLLALFVFLTFSIALSEISIVIVLIAWLVKKAIDRDFSFLKDSVYLVLTAFIAFVALSVANSEHFETSFRGMIKAVKGIAIFFVLIDTFKTREQVNRLVKILIVLFAVVLFDGLWQYLMGKDLIRGKDAGFFNEDFRRRITAGFSYYSQLGTFLILLNSFFAGLLFGKASLLKREKLLLALLIVFGSAGLFFTASRASWMAFAAALFFLGVMRRSKLLLGGLVIVGALAWVALPDYMLIHFDAERKEQSVSERVMLWQRAIDVIKAHPFLGCGINTYNLSHSKYDTVKDSRVKGYYAHNGYLQLGAEIGIFGIAFFILFLLLYFIRTLHKARDIPIPVYKDAALGILSGCFGFLVLVFVDTVLQSFQTNTLFWMFMALATVMVQASFDPAGESAKKGFLS
ncbi:MAG: O-antigen ligase family protein [Candidatus Omnitrophica bacterium]|nr:O-antigen ligase family protein [Candidatus Omnitrophota bacterium]